MKCPSASQLSSFPASWSLPQVQEVVIPHTHLRWNTSCIGTALFLTVLFQDISDLYLFPQQLCPWLEAGQGKCDSPAAPTLASMLWNGDLQVALPPCARRCWQERGSTQPEAAQKAAQKSCWQWCRGDGTCQGVVMLYLTSTKTSSSSTLCGVQQVVSLIWHLIVSAD